MNNELKLLAPTIAIGAVVLASALIKPGAEAESCLIISCDETGCGMIDIFCAPAPINACGDCHSTVYDVEGFLEQFSRLKGMNPAPTVQQSSGDHP